MAQNIQLDQEAFSCSICLDLLKDPVALSCGHNYCMSCVQSHWDEEDGKGLYSCPQCRQSFLQRPVLVKNTMLAFLVEELKKSGLQEAEGCCAGPDDVSCDVCSGRKLKAVKSCLQCLVSYCERHLRPHCDVAVLQNHQLVAPCSNLQDSLCSEHNKVKEMFCRTEQQCICLLCSVETHKGHDVTAASTERSQRQRELEATRLKILHKIQLKERDVELLQEEALSIGRSAQEALRLSGNSFTELSHLLEKRRTEVEREIRSQQQTQEAGVQELQDQVQRDLTELRRTLAQLDSLALTPDHNHFLLHYPSLIKATEAPDSGPIHTSPEPCFKKVMEAVSELTTKIQQTLKQDMDHISLALSRVQLLLPEPGPKTREDFLKYSKEITLDPNTVNTRLSLSEGNKRVTSTGEYHSYPDHPDRFDGEWQVLSREGLTGRCYWEVERSRRGWCGIAVSYKDIERKGSSDECGFGLNNKSWMLWCYKENCTFCFNKVKSKISVPDSSRIGVYLDHSAGALSFYSVSQMMTLLHRVHSTFSQPLFAGIRIYPGFIDGELCDITAHFPKLK